MKRLLKIFIMFILVLSLFPLNSSTTEAATKKIAHVNIKSGTLSVRSGAGTKYKKVGSLKKDTGVYVYSKTKSGWSEIRYKKKKAYVATKYLKFADSYLLDKSKVYTYRDFNGDTSKHVYAGVYNDGNKQWDKWRKTGKYPTHTYTVSEDINGLYLGFIDSDHFHFIKMKYPVKKDKTWKNMEDDLLVTYRITSVSKTVKTPAGTFKNCIEVTSDEGYIYKMYYAKNVGLVKTVYSRMEGEKPSIDELISLKNK